MDSKDLALQFDKLVTNCCEQIAEFFSIDKRDLLTFVNMDMSKIQMSCAFVHPNAKQCTGKPMGNGWCARHQEIAQHMNINKSKIRDHQEQEAKKLNIKKPKQTKLTEQILMWLQAAVPKTPTELQKHGVSEDRELYIHKPMNFLFVQVDAEMFEVVGKWTGTEVVPLSPEEITICEERGWFYE